MRAGGATYVARFGPGYARFAANVHGIESDLTQCVAPDDPVKLSRLHLRNTGSRPRRIAVAQTVRWMLGALTDRSFDELAIATPLMLAGGIAGRGNREA